MCRFRLQTHFVLSARCFKNTGISCLNFKIRGLQIGMYGSPVCFEKSEPWKRCAGPKKMLALERRPVIRFATVFTTHLNYL